MNRVCATPKHAPCARLVDPGSVCRSTSNRIHQEAYATVDLELSIKPASLPGLRIVAWGKNLTDRAYLSSLLQTNFADGVSYSEPRTYGLRAEYSF